MMIRTIAEKLFITLFFFASFCLFPEAKETSAAPYSDLEEVLQSPDFGIEKKVWDIRFKDLKNDEKTNGRILAPWIEKLRGILAFILRIVIIVSIAVLIFVLVFLILRLGKHKFTATGKKAQSEEIFLETGEEPETLLNDAMRLYSGGFKRLGWVKCNACAITAFNKKNIAIPKNATETECLDIVRKFLPQFETAFNQFIKNWIFAAYSRNTLNDADFEEALVFCRSILKDANEQKKI
ncbi:hypothetical protein FACS1894190_16430 [Spirochaetia bacterium]|nr:hypothetical protein FACS1894190_16430 [Spirochaetia bacterium]